mgnify:CR=1 FL=1
MVLTSDMKKETNKERIYDMMEMYYGNDTANEEELNYIEEISKSTQATNDVIDNMKEYIEKNGKNVSEEKKEEYLIDLFKLTKIRMDSNDEYAEKGNIKYLSNMDKINEITSKYFENSDELELATKDEKLKGYIDDLKKLVAKFDESTDVFISWINDAIENDEERKIEIYLNELYDAMEYGFIKKDTEKLIKDLNSAGIDINFIIQESFLGYKYRKKVNKLYEEKAETPTKLIKMYYSLAPGKVEFDKMKKAFITKYINNESELEGTHNSIEIKGLKAMYEYIHSDDVNYLFDVYTLKDLNAKLFSFTEYPEYAGDFRRFDVYLPGTGTELSEWSMIRPELKKIDIEIQKLLEDAKELNTNFSTDKLLEYLDNCVVIGCKLIKVHPFDDGNGRTIRGFINKLFEDVGLPPIYIKANERTEYHLAMNKANNEGNYDYIKGFYRYKVCDSIIELDINNRIKKQDNEKKKIKELKINS